MTRMPAISLSCYTFNLFQHFILLTYDFGHNIDLVITNASSEFIISPFMLDTYISDQKIFALTLTFQSRLFTKQPFPVVNLEKNNIYELKKCIAAAFSYVEHLYLDFLGQFFN